MTVNDTHLLIELREEILRHPIFDGGDCLTKMMYSNLKDIESGDEMIEVCIVANGRFASIGVAPNEFDNQGNVVMWAVQHWESLIKEINAK